MNATEIWKKSIDADNLVCLSLDMPDRQTNILTEAAMDALSTELDVLHASPPRGVIIRSAKQNGFIAGADINTFAEQTDIEETFTAIKQAQAVLDRLAALPCPTVAVIHGFCLGGGFELALACQYRIADNASSTRIGLPEVKLGIHPGYGGSVRLIDLIGVIPAMTMMLSGRILSAHAAKTCAVVDASVATRQLLNTARSFLLNAPQRHTPSCHQRWLSHSFLRPIVGYFLRQKTAKKIQKAHYPAPFALIDCWQKQPADHHAYFAAEASSVAVLIQTVQAQNLVRLFLLQDRLKAYGKRSDFKAHHVHVIGAGTMGGDIAAWCALRGLSVTLQDQSAIQIAPAIARAHRLFKRQLKTANLIRAAQDRLIPDLTGAGLAKADVVIEAIFEDLAAKQTLFNTIEPQLQTHTVLTSNTSSIPLEHIAEGLQQPERLVGLHFFNPVAKMQLIEVVQGTYTDEQWSQHAAAFVRQVGRLPLPVKSTPGFLVNRLLMPYLLEAVQMLEEGIPARIIDHVAVDFGMPRGPRELADQVGLDICHSVAQMLSPSLGLAVPDALKNAISEGHLGLKSGQGFYRYNQNGHKQSTLTDHTSHRVDQALIQQRLILRLLNECISCLADGIVEDDDLVDAGMVFATGFAPFRGGPMRYIQEQGAASLHQELTQLQSTFGDRFTPHLKWEDWL
jgi:3-hydroxyacyl-CoA dehydrogenase/enoyl-CoA hydratase/3-hydroxybutyryl-CoA epimerase